MASYISSNNNRFYVGIEASYGAAAVEQLGRIPAVSLRSKHQKERLHRKDKTGTRTFLGLPANGRYRTSFELSTYMAAWADSTQAPAHGALFQAAMGGDGAKFAGGVVLSSSGQQLTFTSTHSLSVGQAVATGGEIRFVTGVTDSHSVILNAPFTTTVKAGDTIDPTYSYLPGAGLKSATIMDCWSPASALQRLLAGSAVDSLQIDINGDFHQFKFGGYAADVIDSASFTSGQAGLQQFPEEPDSTGFDYTLIPGHLGQAWIGSVPGQMLTLSSAKVSFSNNTDPRAKEFGQLLPRAVVAGERDVEVEFSVYAQDDEQTKALYQAARQNSPVSVMFQLGQQAGQLCGIFLNSVMLEVPEFDDGETRLIWNFRKCRAQGSGDDEIAIAFA